MRIERIMFIDSISTNQVQFRRVPGLTSIPDAHPSINVHQLTLTTGFNSAVNADTGIFAANCQRWRVILERMDG